MADRDSLAQQDAESIAKALGVTVEDLKNTKVSLYDIIVARRDPEAEQAFIKARSVFRVANFYLIQALLKTK